MKDMIGIEVKSKTKAFDQDTEKRKVKVKGKKQLTTGNTGERSKAFGDGSDFLH